MVAFNGMFMGGRPEDVEPEDVGFRIRVGAVEPPTRSGSRPGVPLLPVASSRLAPRTPDFVPLSAPAQWVQYWVQQTERLPIHSYTLSGKYMSKGTLVAEFTVPLHKPSACFFLCAWFSSGVRKGTRRARGTTPDLVKFTGYMGEILG